jgi:hypothetical protein
MDSADEASKIAETALAKASEFLSALRPLASAGFDALDEAIGRIGEMPEGDSDSMEVRSTAISGLTLTLSHIDLGADD